MESLVLLSLDLLDYYVGVRIDLTSLINREMIYQLLSGEYRHLFLQQAFYAQQDHGAYNAIS